MMKTRALFTLPGSALSRVSAFFLLGASTVLAADPAAHDPQFNKKNLWPEDVQKTDYARQTWDKAPLFVWAAKGKDGQQTDPGDTANWIVDGKEPTAAPGEGDDILFPSGSAIRLKETATLRVRHLTVEKGVRLPDSFRLRPQGNIWIQGSATVESMSTFEGPNNVFLRNDNLANPGIANKVAFNKPIGSSIEILGSVLAYDEMGFFCGTIIVGPDARLLPGNRSSQPVYPDAKLILTSGSTFQKRGGQPNETDLVVSGAIQGGTPERPLTRDATLGLSFKTKGTEAMSVHFNAGSPKDYGMVINPSGSLAVYSVDPNKARLVITWNGLASKAYGGAGDPDPVERHVDAVLQGNIHLSGVHFDRILKGGILIGDKAMSQQSGVSFGKNNQGQPAELFKVLDEPIKAKLVYSSSGVPTPASKKSGE